MYSKEKKVLSFGLNKTVEVRLNSLAKTNVWLVTNTDPFKFQIQAEIPKWMIFRIFVAFLEYMNFSKIESFAISSPLSATSNNLPICHINLRYKSTLSLLSYSTWIKKPNNMMRTFPQPLFQMVL